MTLMTPQKAGETIGVSPALIYRWCKEQRLPHYRCGTEGKRGKILIDPKDLEVFLQQCRVEPHGLLDDLE
ncbi:MAG: helix-turn-helix domain-containing protein [Planctomycetes bacterium]|jgi:predicted site-specific integrase-resolvase|nr:helix-turn-helix domain-containing protein [Planctomycetota bacterium]